VVSITSSVSGAPYSLQITALMDRDYVEKVSPLMGIKKSARQG
jgi:hypothetical protein